jgi:hypothetical protein
MCPSPTHALMSLDASDAGAAAPRQGPEVALVAAILHQAALDLKPNAPARERVLSMAFFANEGQHLEAICDLVGLDHVWVQRLVERQYPGVASGEAGLASLEERSRCLRRGNRWNDRERGQCPERKQVQPCGGAPGKRRRRGCPGQRGTGGWLRWGWQWKRCHRFSGVVTVTEGARFEPARHNVTGRRGLCRPDGGDPKGNDTSWYGVGASQV